MMTIRCPQCMGKGSCSVCESKGWVEIRPLPDEVLTVPPPLPADQTLIAKDDPLRVWLGSDGKILSM